MPYTVAASEDGDILLRPQGRTAIRESVDEATECLAAALLGRELGAEVALLSSERGLAAARLVRTLMTDPSIAEPDRGIIIGAALAEIDRASDD